MKHTLGLLVVLAGVWLVWSGHLETLLLAMGLVSCLAVVWLARRMGLVDEEGAPLGVTLRFASYLPYLVREIVKSNLDVARRILTPGLPIDPRIFRTRASQRTPLGRVIYANSITLTPGTVTIGLDGDEVEVHALSGAAQAGVETLEMDRRVRRVEGEP